MKIQKIIFFYRHPVPPPLLVPSPPFIDLNTTDQAKECVGGGMGSHLQFYPAGSAA